MSRFTLYSHEAISLEKKLNLELDPVTSELEDIDDIYDINRCVEWIKNHNFRKVCLQFPDHLLPDSSEVALKLQKNLNQTVYILGDTAYESCCIDYIAAAHIGADAIIHYGPICFSKTSANIPYLNVFEKYDLNSHEFKSQLLDKFSDIECKIVVLLDSTFTHYLGELQKKFRDFINIKLYIITEVDLIAKNQIIIFVSKDTRKLSNLEFSLKPRELYNFDNDSNNIKKHQTQSMVLRRRNYIIEKIKDSTTIGIVIGTLGVKNYMLVIERLKKLISLSGKKYYLISVGKPTVPKLANFPELDMYVVVTCSLSEIYESRDFYKPIATPYDVEIALNADRDANIEFSYDYNQVLGENFELDILKSTRRQKPDVSLLTNKIRSLEPDADMVDISQKTNEISVKSPGSIAVKSSFGAGFLADRSWKGLEQNLGETEVELAQEGRRGIAQGYDGEQSN